MEVNIGGTLELLLLNIHGSYKYLGKKRKGKGIITVIVVNLRLYNEKLSRNYTSFR
jgi:hypothetical protein